MSELLPKSFQYWVYSGVVSNLHLFKVLQHISIALELSNSLKQYGQRIFMILLSNVYIQDIRGYLGRIIHLFFIIINEKSGIDVLAVGSVRQRQSQLRLE